MPFCIKVVQTVKNLPAVETRVRSLGREDPLEEEMVPHSSILAWEIPWTEEPGGLQSMGSQRKCGLQPVTNLFIKKVPRIFSKDMLESQFVHLFFKVLPRSQQKWGYGTLSRSIKRMQKISLKFLCVLNWIYDTTFSSLWETQHLSKIFCILY